MNTRKSCSLPAIRVRAETRDKIVSIAIKRDVPLAQIVREAVEFFLSKNDNLIIERDNQIIEKGA